MKAVILYHKNCLDGSVAALVMERHLPLPKGIGEYSHVVCEAVQYGEPPPIDLCAGNEVFIVDFCYDVNATVMIAEVATGVTVLDHHKTAIERFETAAEDSSDWPKVLDKCDMIFDTTKSGAQLAWEYCHSDATEMPWYVAHTADRDLWKFELDNTNAIVKGLFPYVDNLRMLDVAIACGKKTILTQGIVLLKAEERLVQRMLGHQHTMVIDGHTVPCVNSAQVMSELGHVLAKDNPFAAIYYFDGEAIKFSLRSNDDGEDVALIAQKFGGGGHRNAAGFTVTLQKLQDFIDS